MALNNLIDLIADLAASRVAQEGKKEAETPDAVITLVRAFIAMAKHLIADNQNILLEAAKFDRASCLLTGIRTGMRFISANCPTCLHFSA